MSRKRRRRPRQNDAARASIVMDSPMGAEQPVAADSPATQAGSAAPRSRRGWIRLLLLLVILLGLFSLKHFWWPPVFRHLAADRLGRGHVREGLAWLEYVDWLAPDGGAASRLHVNADSLAPDRR